jgi:hypothetical protein
MKVELNEKGVTHCKQNGELRWQQLVALKRAEGTDAAKRSEIARYTGELLVWRALGDLRGPMPATVAGKWNDPSLVLKDMRTVDVRVVGGKGPEFYYRLTQPDYSSLPQQLGVLVRLVAEGEGELLGMVDAKLFEAKKARRKFPGNARALYCIAAREMLPFSEIFHPERPDVQPREGKVVEVAVDWDAKPIFFVDDEAVALWLMQTQLVARGRIWTKAEREWVKGITDANDRKKAGQLKIQFDARGPFPVTREGAMQR